MAVAVGHVISQAAAYRKGGNEPDQGWHIINMEFLHRNAAKDPKERKEVENGGVKSANQKKREPHEQARKTNRLRTWIDPPPGLGNPSAQHFHF